MREQFPPVKINVATVNIAGWPGLALVLIAVAIAMEFPETRWLLVARRAVRRSGRRGAHRREKQARMTAAVVQKNGAVGARADLPRSCRSWLRDGRRSRSIRFGASLDVSGTAAGCRWQRVRRSTWPACCDSWWPVGRRRSSSRVRCARFSARSRRAWSRAGCIPSRAIRCTSVSCLACSVRRSSSRRRTSRSTARCSGWRFMSWSSRSRSRTCARSTAVVRRVLPPRPTLAVKGGPLLS